MRASVLIGLMFALIGCRSGPASPAASPNSDADADPDTDAGAARADVRAAVVGDRAAEPPAHADAAPAVVTTGVPVIPVGLDAYRQWSRLPYVRIGDRAYMRSTYDRNGGNDGADARHFIRQPAPDHSVTLDVTGPGVFTFFRANRAHGSPWSFTVDGTERRIEEVAMAGAGPVFAPAGVWPTGLAFTWPTSKGADLSWVPAPFERSLELAYGRTFYGTGYYIYHLYPEGATNLSAPLRSWDGGAPAADVVALVARAGEDVAPTGGAVTTTEGALDLPADGAVEVARFADGPRTIRALRFVVPGASAQAFGRARLRITWDGRAAASVDAPVALFFGTGSIDYDAKKEFQVRGFPVTVRFDAQAATLSFYYPMPYVKSARIELLGAPEAIAGVRWHLRSEPYNDPSNWAGYFHATFQDHAKPVPRRDLVFLDTTKTEGGGDWCGSFVGTSFIFTDRAGAGLGTLEGDPRFFFDDADGPQGQGTGTEEWGGGGDYWNGGQLSTLPFAGHPTIGSMYRFLIADAMPFGRNARIQFEHGGADESGEHYSSVTYWYGAPGACLMLTDTLDVGDAADEAKHAYASSDASAVEMLTSRYEWGVDDTSFAPLTDNGRHTTGTSSFTLRLDPDNAGVLLRRRLDYSYPDQRAEIEIADDRDGAPFQHAATWYLAGSTRYVLATPATETSLTGNSVQLGPRRWRDDEVLLPARLTAKRSAIRVRIRFTPSNLAVMPGAPPAPQAWSEFRYQAYSYVLPRPR
jgi:hypothetical protein